MDTGSTTDLPPVRGSFEGFGIKEMFKDVSADFTHGWKSLASKAKQEAKTINKKARKALATYEEGSAVRYDQVYDCDFNCGFSLWKRFQGEWIGLRKDMSQNAARAEKSDAAISEVNKNWTTWEAAVSTFHVNLVALPDIIANVEICQAQVGAIGNQIQKIERLLLEHEDVCQRVELEKSKLGEKIELSRLVEKRQTDFQTIKAKYEMTEEESGEMAKVLERQESLEKQQVYEDAFIEQMERYVQFGELEMPIAGHAVNENANNDISFDDADLDALKEFLGPEELNTVIQTKQSVAPLNDNGNEDG